MFATANLRSHERCLDFRAGVLGRQTEWVSPAGCAVKVTSTRMVSLTQRSIAAICYEVEPVDQTTRIVVQSELVANEQLPVPGGDPRGAAALKAPLVEQADASRGARAGLVHSTRESALIVAAVMDHVVDGPPGTLVQSESFPHLGRTMVSTILGARAAAAARQGRRVRVVRFPVVAGSSRPGRRGVGRCHADRLGGAAGRATQLSRQVLGMG